MQPAGFAAGVVLILPDRYTQFDLVNDVAAGSECRVAVGGAHSNPDREIADRQGTDPMRASRTNQGKALLRLAKDALAFTLCKRNIGLIVQALYRAPGVFIAHPAFKCHTGAGAGIGKRP